MAKGAVIVIALFMALQQVGVAEEIVTAAFTLILGAVALAVGLAFGLGNRDLAGEITRRWYEEGQRRDRRRTDRQGPNTPPGGRAADAGLRGGPHFSAPSSPLSSFRPAPSPST